MKNKKYHRRPIYLFTCLDNNYVEYLDVLVKSIEKNTKRKVIFYICTSQVITGEYIKSIKSKKIVRKKVIIIDTNKIKKLINFTTLHPIECYLRIMIGTILPKEIGKVIYIDPDMIVNADISEIYDKDMSSHIIAGVHDHCYQGYAKKDIQKITNIKLKNYINAGLMVINLTKWRRKKIEESLLKMVKKYGKNLKLLDQDIINIVLRNEIYLLEHEWNYYYPARSNKKIKNYHMVGRGKGISVLNTNLTTKLLFFKYSKQRKGKLILLLYHIIFSLPLGVLLNTRYKLQYKFDKLKVLDYIKIFLVAYPPVTIFVIYRFVQETRRFGFQSVIKILGEITKK